MLETQTNLYHSAMDEMKANVIVKAYFVWFCIFPFSR